MTISANEGFDSGEIFLLFEENFQTVEKKAFVKISAQGCEPQIIEISQSKALPYIIVDHDRTVTKLPADVCETTIYIKTNLSDITAELKDGATLTDAYIEKISDSEFKFKCSPDGNDPQVYKNAVVIISADECENLEVEIKQNGRLHFDFMAANNFSPSLPTAVPEGISTHKVTIGNNEYSLSFTKFYYRSSNKCLMMAKQGYFELPSIPGKTLTKIAFTFRGHTSSRSAKITIKGTGDESATLYSKENISLEIPNGVNDFSEHTLVVGEDCDNKPAAGTSYRICQGYSSNCILRYLDLQYE